MQIHPRFFALVCLLLAACGGGSPSEPVAASAGAETASATSAESTPTTTLGAAENATGAATPVARPRATLSPTRLDTCTPEGASIANAQPVTVTVGNALGGCPLRTPNVDPAAEPRALELNLLGGPQRVAEVVSCAEGATPSVDFARHSYATFQTTHLSSEHWELAFAVDDGERVHIGLMPVRLCQGAQPSTVVDLTGLDIAVPGRPLTVHRCNPPPLRCPPVP